MRIVCIHNASYVLKWVNSQLGENYIPDFALKRCGISLILFFRCEMWLKGFFSCCREEVNQKQKRAQKGLSVDSDDESQSEPWGGSGQWPVPVEHQSVGRTKLIKGFSKNCSVPPQTLRELDVMSIFSANDIVIFFYRISEISDISSSSFKKSQNTSMISYSASLTTINISPCWSMLSSEEMCFVAVSYMF